MGPEAKLYKKFKKATPTISWNRIENLAVPGMPDALGYNKYNQFFTVEFKVTKSNKVRFSPHQVGWHMRHPYNTFITIDGHDGVTPKKPWVQKQNFIKNLRKQHLQYRGIV